MVGSSKGRYPRYNLQLLYALGRIQSGDADTHTLNTTWVCFQFLLSTRRKTATCFSQLRGIAISHSACAPRASYYVNLTVVGSGRAMQEQ